LGQQAGHKHSHTDCVVFTRKGGPATIPPSCATASEPRPCRTMAQMQPLVKLYPRRKGLGRTSTDLQDLSRLQRGRAPTVLSLDAIAPLFDLPQVEAAQRLGVALTTLKVVCRKLGLRPFRRKRQTSTDGKGTTRTQQEAQKEAINNYYHIECTPSGRFGLLCSPSPEPSPRSSAPSSGRVSRAATTQARSRSVSRGASSSAADPIFPSTTRFEPDLSSQPVSFSAEHTTTWHWQSSIPRVAEGSLSADMTTMMSSSDDLSWLLCNSDPLAQDILAKSGLDRRGVYAVGYA